MIRLYKCLKPVTAEYADDALWTINAKTLVLWFGENTWAYDGDNEQRDELLEMALAGAMFDWFAEAAHCRATEVPHEAAWGALKAAMQAVTPWGEEPS